jgi:hypothetical protein
MAAQKKHRPRKTVLSNTADSFTSRRPDELTDQSSRLPEARPVYGSVFPPLSVS